MISRVVVTIALLLPMTAMAQGAGHRHEERMRHDQSNAQPTEPGQSAFAAIQEIVALLEADPDTDWSRVDIAALRRHLVDMHNVTVAAKVASEPIDHGVEAPPDRHGLDRPHRAASVNALLSETDNIHLCVIHISDGGLHAVNVLDLLVPEARARPADTDPACLPPVLRTMMS